MHAERLVRQRVNLLLELAVHSRDGRATDTGAVEVLERDEQRDDTRLLLALAVARGERDGDRWVVDRVACVDVRVERLHGRGQHRRPSRHQAEMAYGNERATVRGARAGDQDAVETRAGPAKHR